VRSTFVRNSIYILSTLFIIVINTPALAYAPFSCFGQNGKVQVSINQTEDSYVLTYLNSEGRKNFPVYEGVVTRSAMGFINMGFKELFDIDKKLVLAWKKSSCQFSKENPLILSCNGEGRVLIPENQTLKSYILNTSISEEKSLSNTFHVFKFRLGLDSQSLHYSLTFPFDPKKCYRLDQK